MPTTARFYVSEVTLRPSGPGFAAPAPHGSVVLTPAYRGGENKAWASATPSGRIELTLSREALPWWQERLGRDLHITFDDAPEPDA